jgi:N-acetylglucosaminyldiphosphoundecaprenol N-acetyl-beta-D-mannosaminyltransferase
MNLFLFASNVFDLPLGKIPTNKLLINTINAHSYNIAQKDKLFAESLKFSHVLLPDGISIVFGKWFLNGVKLKKIAGEDLFYFEMNKLNQNLGSCFFLGSNENTLIKILERARTEFPNVKIKTFSPPFTSEFSMEENNLILEEINDFKPDVLFVGMTAPKQEKWAYQHFEKLDVNHICCIGAVFDFYAGTVKRAPKWTINLGFEWLYRLIQEPQRLWRRYLSGNVKFVFFIFKEKMILILNKK